MPANRARAAAATGPPQAGPVATPPTVPLWWALLASAAGLAGAAALGSSFGLLPSPPPLTAPTAALTRYAAGHHHAMLAAAWLAGTGTLLQVIFVLALVHLAGARAALAGRIATVACAAVLGVSLVYDVMLISIAQSAALGGRQATTALVAYGLFAAVEHVFLVAPPLLLPLGLILLRAPVLPRVFAWLAVILGAAVPVLGLAGLFTVTANNNGPAGTAINALVAAQGLWIIAAAITLPLRRPPAAAPPAHIGSTGRAAQGVRTLSAQPPVPRPAPGSGRLRAGQAGGTAGSLRA